MKKLFYKLSSWFELRLEQESSYMSDNESGGDSLSSRGFRKQANYYTAADDKVAFTSDLFNQASSSGDSSIHC